MRSFFQKILQRILRILSVFILKKYKPKIVAITGSVGKTSTKDAVFTVLNSKFKVRKTEGNYNNEIGVPLVIIGAKTAGRNIFGWFLIFLKGVWLIFFPCQYPEILVLELGVDKPKDMDYLLSFIKPDVAIITAISDIPVHLEFFKDVNELVKEKGKLVLFLKEQNVAILNYDEERVREFGQKTKARVLFFGFSEKADLYCQNIFLNPPDFPSSESRFPSGLFFRLRFKENTIPIKLPYILGRHQIYAALAAAACGICFEINLVEISQALEHFKPPKGRMNLIKGIKNTFIIDDSYNASPASTLAALDVLAELKCTGRKIAVLGDMRELGPMTEQGHRQVGKRASLVSRILICVGQDAKFIADEAKKQGMSEERVFEFDEATRAGKFVQRILKDNDLVLIKGSQAVRMEQVVKELMAEPQKAAELLVRQDWQK